MELRHVRAFLAICEELHFGRAAARLHLAQPTLSEHLRLLERAVGARLVDRGRHGVALTEAGRAFEPAARRGVAELDAASASAGDVGRGAVGTVRVGFNYPAGSRILPAVLRRLRSRHPGLRTTLTELRSGPQLAGIAEDRLDVGFVFGPAPRDSTPGTVRLRPLLSTPLVAVVGGTHPLARHPSVSFAELAEHPCVLFERGLSPACHDAIVGTARRAGHELRVVDEVNDSGATAVVVGSGELVGFASRIRAAATSGLHAVDIVDPVPTLQICAAWSRHGTPQAGRFLACLDGPEPAADPADEAVAS